MIIAVFLLVYLGMLLGGFPRLRLDRTGIALLGAITLIATGAVSVDEAMAALDLPTMALLFGLMVVSAQLRLGGFYSRAAIALTASARPPATLLLGVVLGSGALSAIFSNDIICLAMTPILVDACRRRQLDPVPFLLGLAAASNVGSAATLIGNPQNMLIGERLALSFMGYLASAGWIALLGLVGTWGVLALQWRHRWQATGLLPDADGTRPFDRWQVTKGLVVAAVLMLVFLEGSVRRDVAALAAAGVLLTSARLHSRDMLGLVDWQLLVLFGGLFVVNHAMQGTGLPEAVISRFRDAGVELVHPGALFGLTVVLSNLVSNVPAVMLLLPMATDPFAGPVLALASTLAGNLLIVGSIANIIVVDGATRAGVPITWRQHARTGVPVTLVTLAIAALGLIFQR